MIPVWVKLRSLPLELWNQRALGKILSKVGKPICTDQLTASRGRIPYARVLVEVDAAKELVKEVSFKLPDGLMFHQDIEYEFSPKFCSHCKMIGHSLHDCKAIPAQKQLDRSSKGIEKDGPFTESCLGSKGEVQAPNNNLGHLVNGPQIVDQQGVGSHSREDPNQLDSSIKLFSALAPLPEPPGQENTMCGEGSSFVKDGTLVDVHLVSNAKSSKLFAPSFSCVPDQSRPKK